MPKVIVSIEVNHVADETLQDCFERALGVAQRSTLMCGNPPDLNGEYTTWDYVVGGRDDKVEISVREEEVLAEEKRMRKRKADEEAVPATPTDSEDVVPATPADSEDVVPKTP